MKGPPANALYVKEARWGQAVEAQDSLGVEGFQGGRLSGRIHRRVGKKGEGDGSGVRDREGSVRNVAVFLLEAERQSMRRGSWLGYCWCWGCLIGLWGCIQQP